MSGLHVFTDGTDWIIAASTEDADAVNAEHCGVEKDDHNDHHGNWKELPDDQTLPVWADIGAPEAEGCPCLNWVRVGMAKRTPNGHLRGCPVGCPEKTAAEWATGGRGFLCSTEW